MSATLPAPGLVAPDLADRFGLILDLLRRTAASRLASNRIATPLLLILWARMHRLTLRFASLVRRIGAGTLRPPRPTRPRPGRVPPRGPRLPERLGWLIRLVPEIAVNRCQLQHLLSQPDMVALLDAEPRFGWMLRPLCRMLALPPIPRRCKTPEAPVPAATPAPAPERHFSAADTKLSKADPAAPHRPATQG